MSVTVSFRIVGLYCYAESVHLPNNNSSDSVQSIMDALKSQVPYSYAAGASPFDPNKFIVDTFSFTYPSQSPPPAPLKEPYNSKFASPGFRDLSNSIGSTSLVWQYYRSVTGTIDGNVIEIKLLQKDQPSFAKQSLDFNDSYFGSIPPSFQLRNYNLTWRLVQIQASAETQALFSAVKADAQKRIIEARKG